MQRAARQAGLRPALKTSLIALMDPIAGRGIHRLTGLILRITNRLLVGDLRFQALPNPFDLWVDGLEVPVFEEFGAGTEALHLERPEERAALLRNPAYRRRFRRQWGDRLRGQAYHRDFARAHVVACPEAALIGKSFAEIAAARGRDAVDTFLDLAAEHGDALRWYTVVANDRPDELEWILRHPDILLGFSDAGAHLRNMAYYNFPLRMLRLVREGEKCGRPVLSIERAVQRLTGELAQWFGIDAGTIRVGGRADIVVVDPAGLDHTVDQIHESPVVETPDPGAPPWADFGGLRRLVRRNDAAVRHVLIRGRMAWTAGTMVPELGHERGFGGVLRATAG